MEWPPTLVRGRFMLTWIPRAAWITWAVDRCLVEVALATGIACAVIKSPKRTRRVTRARWCWWWLVREMTGISANKLACLVGVDHTSIMYAMRKLDDWTAYETLGWLGEPCGPGCHIRNRKHRDGSA